MKTLLALLVGFLSAAVLAADPPKDSYLINGVPVPTSAILAELQRTFLEGKFWGTVPEGALPRRNLRAQVRHAPHGRRASRGYPRSEEDLKE